MPQKCVGGWVLWERCELDPLAGFEGAAGKGERRGEKEIRTEGKGDVERVGKGQR